MPRADRPSSIDSQANMADLTMHMVYVGGVLYSAAELIAIRARAHADLLKELKSVSRVFGPAWNFVDAFGVLFDARKDYQNRDAISAAMNTFSSLQLMAGTMVGLIARHSNLAMSFGETTASTLSGGSFAVCMFFSAAIAAYKEKCLEDDITNIENDNDRATHRDIIERIILRNPTQKTALTALQTEFLAINTNSQRKETIRNQFIGILEAEQQYQTTAKWVWGACGIAMTIVALTCPITASLLVMVSIGAILVSAYARMQLRAAEEKMNNKIDAIVNEKPSDAVLFKGPQYGSASNQNNLSKTFRQPLQQAV